MGVFTEQELRPSGLAPVQVAPAAPAKPGLGETIGAAFSQNNTVASSLRAFRDTFEMNDAASSNPMGFEPLDHIAGYEDSASSFVSAINPAQVEIIKRRVDDENDAREVLARAGAPGIAASVGAGILDPVNLIPIGGWAVKGGRAATTLGRVAEGGYVGAKSAAVAEAILMATQEERSYEEAALNIGASTVLGGALGGAVGLFNGTPNAPKLTERFAVEWDEARALQVVRSSSVGAAARAGGDDLRPASALGVEKMEAKNPVSDNPLLRSLSSPNPETARIAAELAETPYFMTGNDKGVASPLAAETRIKQWQGPLAESLGGVDDAFKRYRFNREAKPFDMARAGVEDITGQAAGKLSFSDFKVEVAKAMRNGDAHAVPEVAEAAKGLRKRVFDPLKDEAVRLGLLPEGVEVTTADSYLTRIYDLEKIATNRNAFVDRLAAWFDNEQIRFKPEDKLSSGELRAEAEKVVATLLGSAPGRSAYDITPNLRGPLKERTLNVPDNVIEDFLENDVERVARIYTRTMAADVELARAFGRADMSDSVEAIKASYEPIMARTKDGPEQARLKKSMDRDVRDLEAMRDRIRGTYGMPDNPMGLATRSMRSLRTLNYLRMLGGMTLSAIPDVARPIMVHGMGRVMRDGLGPLVSNLRGVKLAADEVKLAGTALDMVLDSRAQQMADVFEDFGRYSKVERAITYAGEKMGLVSGMSLWNASMKQFVGVITQTRTLRAITEGASPAEARRLAFLGIDDSMSERIAKQFKAHGDKEGGVWMANTADWTDAEAAATYRGALAKEVDLIIATPGQEKPLWMSTELGKTIGQFKSFTFSTMSRVMINSLQQRDANALQGLIAAVGLGMLAYKVKSAVAGKKTSDDPKKWLSEGLDQSGTMGWIFEANNMAEKVTRAKVGINPALGVAPASRYVDRNVVDSLLGPSVGTVNDTASLVGAASEGKASRSDLHKARRLLPFQNLFYLRWLFDHAEDEAGDAAGLPEKANLGSAR